MFNRSIITICFFGFLLIFLSFNSSFCFEGETNILLGEIDNGSWHENGALYLEVPFISKTKKKEFRKIIFNKYRKELLHKQYFEIAYSEVKDFVTIQMLQRFELYSKDGYLGDYGIEKFAIIVNACGGGIYVYAKLDGRTRIIRYGTIIARLINGGMSREKCKVTNIARLNQSEKLKIERILSDRFLYAMDENNNIITKYFDSLRKNGWKRFEFKSEYIAFKGKLLGKQENQILISGTISGTQYLTMEGTLVLKQLVYILRKEKRKEGRS